MQKVFGALVLLLALPAAAGCQVAAPQPPLPTAAAQAFVPPRTTTAPLPATQTPAPSPLPTNTAATPDCQAGTVHDVTLPSVVAGAAVVYRLYLPPCYGMDAQRYPTLYLLHGNIHDETFWDGLGVNEAADRLIATGALPPLIIIMPAGGELANNTSGGPGSFEALVVDELIPQVDATLCTWATAQGRAIGGISRGGYWALEIAFRHADLFAGVGGHSAALLDIGAGPNLDPVFTAVANPLSGMRIYLDVGSEDWVRHSVTPLHETLSDAAIPHTWLLQPGGHDEAYWSQHVADYLAWYGAGWADAPPDLAPCPSPD